MQYLQASDNLNEKGPKLLLREEGLLSFVGSDQLQEVSPISVLHDDAEAGGLILEESFLVPNDVGVLD